MRIAITPKNKTAKESAVRRAIFAKTFSTKRKRVSFVRGANSAATKNAIAITAKIIMPVKFSIRTRVDSRKSLKQTGDRNSLSRSNRLQQLEGVHRARLFARQSRGRQNPFQSESRLVHLLSQCNLSSQRRAPSRLSSMVRDQACRE